MTATVKILEYNGAGGSTTDITSTASRLSTEDSSHAGTSNPLVKPDAGINRSYWKTFALWAETAPAGTINNIKWFLDGALGWTGCTLYAGTTTAYTQATGTSGTTGADSVVATTDASTYTTAAPLSVAGTLSNPSTGKISDYVVVQADVTTGASAGTLAAETITWRRDET